MENGLELEKEQRKYELAVLLDNDGSESAVSDFLSDMKITVQQKDGPKTINLAYPIKKHTSVSFVVYYFSALPESVVIMKAGLSAKAGVLRSLLITPPIVKMRKATPTNRETGPELVEIRPPKTEAVPNAVLEETLEKILQ